VVADLKQLQMDVKSKVSTYHIICENYDVSKDAVLEMFESLPHKLTWTSALDAWEAYYRKPLFKAHNCKGEKTSVALPNNSGEKLNLYTSKLQAVTLPLTYAHSEVKKLSDLCASVLEHDRRTSEDDRTTFRVTCTRSGTNHCVSSMDVAKHFGSGIVLMFGWKVKLVDPDIEVLVSIVDNDCVVSVALTQDSRHIRNITHFGPTTLRSTIAYGLVR